MSYPYGYATSMGVVDIVHATRRHSLHCLSRHSVEMDSIRSCAIRSVPRVDQALPFVRNGNPSIVIPSDVSLCVINPLKKA